MCVSELRLEHALSYRKLLIRKKKSISELKKISHRWKKKLSLILVDSIVSFNHSFF